MNPIKKKWRDLSVAKKLYAVVGLMAFLIAVELFTLYFAMGTLSSVRALVLGEGLWSKAQKDAIMSLQQYSITKNEMFYDRFENFLAIPLGDRQARLNLLMIENPNIAAVRDGFLKGGFHPEDVDGVISILRRFSSNNYIQRAIKAWTSADEIIQEIIRTARQLKTEISEGRSKDDEIHQVMARISELNASLTRLENEFSNALSEASRWLESLLMILLTGTVFTVEATGIFLTYRFSRNLSLSLNNLRDVAQEVGRGNLAVRAKVESEDELGQLAKALNKMAADLALSIGGRKVAEDANKIKSIFLANTSHEIRTPLGIILGFVEVLRDESLSDSDKRKYLDIIEQTGKNLGRIIDDIIDISKIESGHMDVESSHFDLQAFMHETRDMFAMDTKNRGNRLILSGDPSVRAIATDKVRLRQVLVNLIGNANKFTESGTIEVAYGRRDKKIFFKVADTGIGIDDESAGRIFQIFSQADQSTSRRFGGAGLGLVLSKKIAQALGGDVWLEGSSLGRGSIFVAEVADRAAHLASVSPTDRIEKKISTETRLRGRRALVVDDSADNQLLLKLLLTKLGLSVQTALNGPEALRLIQSEPVFDVVLMDIQMPGMDGYQCTREMRKLGYSGPILAITANAFREARDKCIDAGCDDFLTKPLDVEKMTETFHRFFAS